MSRKTFVVSINWDLSMPSPAGKVAGGCLTDEENTGCVNNRLSHQHIASKLKKYLENRGFSFTRESLI